MPANIQVGLPRMHKEAGERRDFLPHFVSVLHKRGAEICLEHGYGSGMGFAEEDYLQVAPSARFASHSEVYRQDYVLVLRCPDDDEIRLMHPDACLISMLHYPTRPQRVAFLRSLGLEAISLDCIKDDTGRRLVENLRAVAWNGVEVAFQTLRRTYPAPGFDSPNRRPIQVTLLGAGAVGSQVMRAAIRYGDEARHKRLASAGVPGVQLTVVDYDLTCHANFMQDILQRSDILIDATQRPDPTRPVIPNDWVAYLPEYAVILDLSVDPYDCSVSPPHVKGIEGVPQGNLDQYVFAPDDPAYAALPPCINARHRRHVVSCYSWPGIYPQRCMHVYGRQLQPILRTVIEKDGIHNVSPEGRFFERAIARAQLSHWPAEGQVASREDNP
jgi:alanine dehydrogenase